jgi:uncharacterized protein
MSETAKSCGLRVASCGLRVALLLLVLATGLHNHQAVAADSAVSFLNAKDQATCTFAVELARTPEELEKGLMFRNRLDPQAGMLFIFPDEQLRHFWMKHTFIPLDIIFISARLKVVDVHPGAKPLDETVIASRAKARYVLEVNGGKASGCSISKGTKVRFHNIPR